MHVRVNSPSFKWLNNFSFVEKNPQITPVGINGRRKVLSVVESRVARSIRLSIPWLIFESTRTVLTRSIEHMELIQELIYYFFKYT